MKNVAVRAAKLLRQLWILRCSVDSEAGKFSAVLLCVFVLDLKNIVAGIITQFCELERKQTEEAVPLFALGKEAPLRSLAGRPALPGGCHLLTPEMETSDRCGGQTGVPARSWRGFAGRGALLEDAGALPTGPWRRLLSFNAVVCRSPLQVLQSRPAQRSTERSHPGGRGPFAGAAALPCGGSSARSKIRGETTGFAITEREML